MYLQSLASAFPATRYTQRECWDLVQAAAEFRGLRDRSLKILETVLTGASGIDSRHFAARPEEVIRADAEGLSRAYEREAPRLAAQALQRALDGAALRPAQIDALFVCTCTGYLCPGVSSHLAESAGLRPNAFLNDLTGLGCGAALPMLHAAACFLAAYPDATVATVAVEVCSTAFYIDDDPGVLISACLFGDGAAAAIWRGADAGGQWQTGGFRSLHRPEEREKIRFVNAGGKLKNQLHRAVPQVAAEAVRELFAARAAAPDRVITHGGGRDVIDALEEHLPGHRLEDTREVLRRRGNMSSPSVLCALENRLRQANGDRSLWLASFGAGFAAHACELRRA